MVRKHALLAALAATTCSAADASTTTAVQDAMEYLGRRLGVEETLTCIKDDDCPDFYVCGIKDDGFCGHKAVFPVEPLEVGGIIVFAIVMALSNIAGIGGGGVAIPIIMSMFVFPTKPAIAISSLSIFLTTFARFFMNFRERHPDKTNVVVIDYDLVAIMMPTTLAGAQIGAIILVTFPSIIILVVLTLLLAFLSVQSAFKASKLTKTENEARAAAAVQPEVELEEQPSAHQLKPDNDEVDPNNEISEVKADTNVADASSKLPEDNSTARATPGEPIDEVKLTKQVVDTKVVEQDGVDGEFDATLRIKVDKSMNQKELNQLRRSVKAESSHFQWAKQALCIFLLLLLILVNLMMGSSSMDSIVGIKKCDGAYWGIQAAYFLICIVCTVIAVKLAIRDQNLKIKYGGINLTTSDILYSDNKRLAQLLVLGFVGGWIAGALGLGGGSVYNPALLAMGIPPKVSSASGLYLVTFSKIASVLIYYLNGQLDVWYGLWVGFWSCIGMVVGLLLTQFYMKRTGRQSIIVWCLVVIFVVSTVAVPIFGGLSVSQEMDEGLDLWAFSSLCGDKKK